MTESTLMDRYIIEERDGMQHVVDQYLNWSVCTCDNYEDAERACEALNAHERQQMGDA